MQENKQTNVITTPKEQSKVQTKYVGFKQFGAMKPDIPSTQIIHPCASDISDFRFHYIGKTVQYQYGGSQISSQMVYHPQARSNFLSSRQKIGIVCCDTDCNVIAAFNVYINDSIRNDLRVRPVMDVLLDVLATRNVSKGRQIEAVGVMHRGVCVADPTTHNATVCSVIAVLQ